MGTVGHTALHEDVTQESTNAAHVRSCRETQGNDVTDRNTSQQKFENELRRTPDGLSGTGLNNKSVRESAPPHPGFKIKV